MDKTPIPELSRELIQSARTQRELAAWVDGIVSQFRSSEDGRSAFRRNQGDLIKQFKEEIMPLRLYADAYYPDRDDIYFQPAIGNQSYDVRVQDATGEPQSFIQITQAINGYQAHLQMLHLDQYGHAPVSGPPLRKNASGGIDESHGDSQNRDEREEAELELLKAAVIRKADMRYEPDTELIVYFISDGVLDAEYAARIDEFMRSCVVNAAPHFVRIIVVGYGEGFPLRYEVHAA